jgi:hypothetical protein
MCAESQFMHFQPAHRHFSQDALKSQCTASGMGGFARRYGAKQGKNIACKMRASTRKMGRICTILGAEQGLLAEFCEQM